MHVANNKCLKTAVLSTQWSWKRVYLSPAPTPGWGRPSSPPHLPGFSVSKGVNVGVMKPVTSGCREESGRLVSEDAELLAWGAGLAGVDADIAPYLLRQPIAPAEAASRDGVRIDFRIIGNAFSRLASRYDFVIVEGAGGLMVPLFEGFLVADLVTHLSLPLLVVTRPNLGTVNHTLLTCFAAKQLGISVRGVVINNYPELPGHCRRNRASLIASLAGAPLLGIFPHQEGSIPGRSWPGSRPGLPRNRPHKTC